MHEVGQVGQAAHLVEVATAAELLTHGDGIDGLALTGEVNHGVEHPLVAQLVEVEAAQEAAGLVDGRGGQEHRAENLLLGSRNLKDVLVLAAHETDPVALVHFPKVLLTKGAVAKFEEMWQ